MNRLRRIFEQDPVRFSSLLLTFMVILLGAQLIWWVIFYEINFQKTREMRRDFDRVALAVAENRDITVDEFPFLEKTEEGFRVKREIIEQRRQEHMRQLVMLISETIFVLVVITYGSRLILRSIQRERNLNRERATFINSVTHELKTPLATLLLHNQTMQMRKLPTDQQNQMLEQNIQAIRRLEDQINNILLSSEVNTTGQGSTGSDSSGRDTFPREPVRLDQAVEQFLASYRNYFEQHHNATFRWDQTAETACVVRINQELLDKVLFNLVSNAARYCDGNPIIHFEVAQEKRGRQTHCVISVSDNGKGIARTELENIFKPFYRLASDRESIRGSGVGLHLVREILQVAGGSIQAQSEGPGQGSTFVIKLPATTWKKSLA